MVHRMYNLEQLLHWYQIPLGRLRVLRERTASGEPAPLVGQDAHGELVPIALVPPDRLAESALDPEAGLLVGPDGPLVEGEHAQPHAMQPERLEGVREHQLDRLRAQAMAPRVGLADRDVEERGAVVGVQSGERGEPDEPIARTFVDG